MAERAQGAELWGEAAQSADSLCTLTLDLGTAFILLLLEPFPLNCEGLSPSTQTQILRPRGGHQQAVRLGVQTCG